MIAYDEVAETVEASLDRERVRRCLGSLTELQREAVALAYYGGRTYPTGPGSNGTWPGASSAPRRSAACARPPPGLPPRRPPNHRPG